MKAVCLEVLCRRLFASSRCMRPCIHPSTGSAQLQCFESARSERARASVKLDQELHTERERFVQGDGLGQVDASHYWADQVRLGWGQTCVGTEEMGGG